MCGGGTVYAPRHPNVGANCVVRLQAMQPATVSAAIILYCMKKRMKSYKRLYIRITMCEDLQGVFEP